MPRIHIPLILLLLALLGALPDAGSAPEQADQWTLDARTRDYHQRHLDIHITPDIPAGTVAGRVRLQFESRTEDLQRLRLHCQETTVSAVRDASGRPLPFKQARGLLAIDLPGPLAAGAQSEVEVVYTAKPTRGLFFHHPTANCPDRPLFLYSQGQSSDNRRWIPCYDQPDDRCSWDIHVSTSKDLQTVSNGVLVGSEVNGDLRTDHWRYAERAPTYLISLIVAPLETLRSTWRNVSVEFSALPGHTEALQTSLAETSNMLEFFSTYLDAPYPWARYAQTYVWDFIYGGMENVTATTLNMRALHTKAARPNYQSEGLVAHELAHMWFGDLLTCRTWKHIWLNEGFATYFTDLFFEDRFGEDEFLLRRRSQNQSYMKGTPRASELKLERDPRGDVPLELFGGKQYSRGAAILHNLRRHLGDEDFRAAIRAYVKRHRDSPVTSEDLRTTAERIAGVDLQWFWNQWVYGLGYPKLDVRYDANAKQLIVRQTQKQNGAQGLFRIRIPIRWGKDGPRQTLTVYRARHVFPMEAAGPFLRFGVGGDLLMQVKQHQTPTAWADALVSDPDVGGRLDAAQALEEFGPVAVPILVKALASDASYAVRKLSAEILGRLEGPGSSEALTAASRDPDARVREAVMAALAGTSRRVAGATLARVVQEDLHPYVRAAAARALGKLKAERALERLTALLAVDSHSDVVRSGALEGLQSLGDAAAVDLALPFLAYSWGKGGTHAVRRAALACMTALGPDDRAVHEAVLPLLDDPYHNMRSWAAEACGKYKIRAAIPMLRRLRDSDWNGGVKGAARKALKRLGWVEPKKRPAKKKAKKKASPAKKPATKKAKKAA